MAKARGRTSRGAISLGCPPEHTGRDRSKWKGEREGGQAEGKPLNHPAPPPRDTAVSSAGILRLRPHHSVQFSGDGETNLLLDLFAL